MRLLVSEASPYARSVRVLVRELNLTHLVDEVQTHPFENETVLVEANPLRKVPCLILDDDSALFDSEVIAAWLDHYAVENDTADSMFASWFENWQLRTFYSLCSGLLDTAVALQQDKMRDPAKRSEFWQARFYRALEHGLSYAESNLDKFPGEFCALHINFACVLEYLDFRHPELRWREKYDALDSWLLSVTERPSLVDTRPA